jgi:glycosyltransferase involved in cell wall biosynthesis
MQGLLDRLTPRFDLIQVEDSAMANYRYPPWTPAVLTDHEVRVAARTGPRHIRGLGWRMRLAWTELDSRRWHRYQPAVWARFDCIQVFTPRDAAALRTMAMALADRVTVNPFGIDLPPRNDQIEEDDDHIVFIGGFAHAPNVDAALWLCREIMPRIRALRPTVRLTIVGSQPPHMVRALAGRDVTVTGTIPSIDLYLRRATVVLAPLRIGRGMRLKVLQAMAYGKAVITTPLGAEGLMGPCQPPVAIGRDSEELARATAALLSAPDARRALGRQARAFVAQHYTWQSYRQRLDELHADPQLRSFNYMTTKPWESMAPTNVRERRRFEPGRWGIRA